MKKPEILISLGSERSPNYAAAFLALGAAPHADYLPDYDSRFSALILAGGGDVNPARYGEKNLHCMGIDDARDEAELRLFARFMEVGKPVLGICRGHQLLNVALGGSLHQHMETAEAHTGSREMGDAIHESSAAEGSELAALYGSRFAVNSSHHQAVKRLAEGLQPVQTAADGTVEGCVHRSLPIWTVQWHPERMCEKFLRPDTVDGALFLRRFLLRFSVL